MPLLKTKCQVATFIALLFHVSGFIAIAFFHSQVFVNLTPLNLLVSLALIFYTQEKINLNFLLFVLAAFSIGFGAEWIGINTGHLFGQYQYGDILGKKWQDVPWMIGVIWFITIYCIGVSMHMLHRMLVNRQPEAASKLGNGWLQVSLVADGAALAVLFDWIIEPVAVRLGFWQWKDGFIPTFNYWCWFGVSILLLLIFRLLRFDKHNLFAVHLLLIQLMFFLLLRFFNN
ncbi:MAG: carotenoid biosynthesis protein [Chitinophagaceae bacterium]